MSTKRLSLETRRAVLAAARRGVPLMVLERALDLNRATVRTIAREDLPKYADLYAEWNAIGSDAFVHRYLTDAFVSLVNQHAKTGRLTSVRGLDSAGRLVGGEWRDGNAV